MQKLAMTYSTSAVQCPSFALKCLLSLNTLHFQVRALVIFGYRDIVHCRPVPGSTCILPNQIAHCDLEISTEYAVDKRVNATVKCWQNVTYHAHAGVVRIRTR